MSTRGKNMLSILIPSRNEPGINEFVRDVESLGIAHEIIVSCDSESKGKGWALREAVKEAKGNLIAFIDGDNEIKARMLLRLLPFMEDCDVAVGSKRIMFAPLRRQIMTRLTRFWFRFLFGVQVDTQTGIKIFRRTALDMIGHYWDADGFIFDAEIIATLQKNGAKIVEVPIEAYIRRQLSWKTVWIIFKESVWLKWRMTF